MKERMDWMNIARYFYLTDERLQQISRDFAADIERALEGQDEATVSAEKSYVSLPGPGFWRYERAGFTGPIIRTALLYHREEGVPATAVARAIRLPVSRGDG